MKNYNQKMQERPQTSEVTAPRRQIRVLQDGARTSPNFSSTHLMSQKRGIINIRTASGLPGSQSNERHTLNRDSSLTLQKTENLIYIPKQQRQPSQMEQELPVPLIPRYSHVDAERKHIATGKARTGAQSSPNFQSLEEIIDAQNNEVRNVDYDGDIDMMDETVIPSNERLDFHEPQIQSQYIDFEPIKPVEYSTQFNQLKVSNELLNHKSKGKSRQPASHGSLHKSAQSPFKSEQVQMLKT